MSEQQLRFGELERPQLPLLDRIKLNRLGRDYLFTGILQPSGFEYYFRTGGISPDPGRTDTWISNHINRSLPWSFSRSLQGFETCFAVIDKNVLDDGKLQSVASFSSRSPWSSYKEYSGQQIVGWDKLLQLFVTEGALEQVKTEFEKVQPHTISWENFMEKVRIIEPGRIALEQNLLQFLSGREK